MSVRIGLLLISAAVVCCCAAPALAQQDYWDVSLPYEVARDNCDDSAGDTHPGEWHNNEGAVSRVRIKASDHQW